MIGNMQSSNCAIYLLIDKFKIHALPLGDLPFAKHLGVLLSTLWLKSEKYKTNIKLNLHVMSKRYLRLILEFLALKFSEVYRIDFI